MRRNEAPVISRHRGGDGRREGGLGRGPGCSEGVVDAAPELQTRRTGGDGAGSSWDSPAQQPPPATHHGQQEEEQRWRRKGGRPPDAHLIDVVSRGDE